MRNIKINAILCLLFYTLLLSCNNDATTTASSEKEPSNQTSTPTEPAPQDVTAPTELMLTFNALKDDESENPQSEILLKIDTKEKKIATVTGEAQSIKAAEYADFGIPNTATSACYSWHAGVGNYFYSVFKDNEVMVYRGWQEEMQEEDGYHWEPMDWNE